MGSWIKRNVFSCRVPILGIERHRIETDGTGVTTLVGFYGCPLHCKYCLNQNCHKSPSFFHFLSAEHVYRQTAIDQIYFQMTGGGVTFGGGEPLLRPKFIQKFRKHCGEAWCINIETSLNVKTENLTKVIPVVNSFIVDIKDMNPQIYEAYTGVDNKLLEKNLQLLASLGLQNKICIRIPLIEGFNTVEDQDRSECLLRKWGYKRFDRFEYRVRQYGSR